MPPRTRQARQAKKSLPTEGSNQNSSLDCTTSQTMVHGDNAMGQDIGNVTQPKKTLTGECITPQLGITKIIISKGKTYLICP